MGIICNCNYRNLCGYVRRAGFKDSSLGFRCDEGIWILGDFSLWILRDFSKRVLWDFSKRIPRDFRVRIDWDFSIKRRFGNTN